MKIKLINVGRNKINEEIDIKKPTSAKIIKAVKKHLLSKSIDLILGTEPNTYSVFVGGMRHVGDVWVENPDLIIN